MGIGYEIDPDSQCYVEKPLVLAATPREYLDRLRLANEVFNDEIRLTRIIDTPSGLSVESSQPAIVGRPASAREIRSEMAELGFREVHTDGVFYRDNDQVLVWDLEGNTLITTEGYFAPIDAMMRTASLELANAFHAG